MASINSKGQIASGVASGIVAVDRVQIDTGGGTRWVDDNTLIYQRTPSNMVVITAPDHHNVQSLDRGANEIAAGGGHWATWLAGDGLRHSRGGYLANAGLKDVGRDGTLALVPNRQVGVGLNFIALQDDDVNTRRFFSLDVVANDVSVLRWGCAIWRNERNETWALLDGQKVPVPTVGPAFKPRLLQVDGEWWVAYNTNESPVGRTLLHPVTEPIGYELAVGDAQFGLDAIAFNGGVLLTWATTEGEAPDTIVRAEFAMNGHLTLNGGASQILEYRTLTKAATPPPSKPPVTPPVEPPKEPTTVDIRDTLAQIRATYSTDRGLTREERGALLNAVAWAHRTEGVGLEAKPSGDNVPQPRTGTLIAQDILRFPGNLGRDVLQDAEGAANPAWGDPGPANPATFVVPVEPTGVVVTPPPVDPPTKPPVTPPVGDSLEQRVAALESQIDVLSTHMAADRAYTDSVIAGLDKQIAAQDKELSEHAALLDALMNDPTKSPTTPPATPSDGATEATLQRVEALLAQIVAIVNTVLPGRKAA